MLVGSLFSGKLLDREYRKTKEKLIRKAERNAHLPNAIRVEDVTDDENFPIEVARFGVMVYYLVVYITACIGYGWCLQKGVNIAVPLILHIISTSHPFYN